ncbi:SpaH/EbpB family LPXTG-anchored major pilin [Schaalia sp. lx-260]|uniref:SpaH/EbpB family LPXTG-anchored major pilin n=1 Tax=Schaalia sp. lx-260 TaxID=2899082 RepID=UPI0022AC2188|nr:SpaH/EbpB family LPXTG-anchored major pilin [Schaalia sp. lx-260]
MDYTKNESWAKIRKVLGDGAKPTGTVTLDSAPVGEKTTGMDGIAKFENLHFGLYKVSETQAPDGATPAEDFYVTLPMPHTEGASPDHVNKYLYNVFAYPKNKVEYITKKVDDSALRSSEQDFSWTLESSVNSYEKDGQKGITKYTITDTLDSRLTYKSIEIKGLAGTEGAQEVTFAEGVDFTATFDQSNRKLTIEFIDFTKLNSIASDGGKLTTQFVTTFNAVGTDGSAVSGGNITDLKNKAYLRPNQDPTWEDEAKRVPSDEPKVELGRIQAIKKDGKTNAALQGAKFELYDEAGNKLKFYDKAGALVESTTSDAEGNLWFGGLRTSDQSSGKELTGDNIVKYYLVEVQAPEGYAKLAEAIEVTLKTDQDGNDQKDEDGSIVTLDIENTPRTLFELPKTGATIAMVLVGGGIILVIGGGLYMFALRQKKSE